MEKIIILRNRVIGSIYQTIIKPILFKFDPERAHNLFINIGKFLGSNFLTRYLTSLILNYQNPVLEQKILGIKFNNPVGLSAGFDKNADLVNIVEDVGFGFIEAGSITANECPGNSGIRLIRFPEKKSIWVHLGLNNKGADKISKKLKNLKHNIVLGISVAKTNCKENSNTNKGIKDYAYTLEKFQTNNIGDFFVINISCPNSFGGQPFHKPDLYENLLKEINKLKIKKPIFVKLSPDITIKNLDRIISISFKYKIDGFVCSNLTKNHSLGKGGLSGKAVEEKANNQLRYIYKRTKRKFILIGVGGIFNAEDAYKKIKFGASLVALITGMVYEGPQLISNINLGITKMLNKDGYKNISEAIGADVK
ncbi:MAG: quinone-dependent dihydroorotate dehydrogenase [Nanoarchaeota archaeon]